MDQQEKPTKFLYLPQAKNDHFIIGGADDRPDASVPGSEPEPGPEEPTGIYPCPCCGYLTFPGLPDYGSSWNWDSSRERESPRSRPSVKAWQAWKEAKISMLSVRWKSRSWSA